MTTHVCPNCQAHWSQKPLTERQHEILVFIRQYAASHGVSPSYENIARHFGFESLATVAEHLNNLERKGWIVKRYNEARSIQLVEAPRGQS